MNTRRFLILVSFILLPMTSTWAQTPNLAEQIKGVYIRYMKAIESGNRKQESEILEKHLSPGLKLKRGRLIQTTDGDPLLRAQDVSEYAIHSLSCKHLAGDWYEVSYFWSETDSVGLHIPLRAEQDIHGKASITYITPEWAGNSYGDDIFDIPAVAVNDRSDKEIFIESFFKAYIHPFVHISPTLEQEISQIQQTYCTPEVLTMLARKSEEYKSEILYIRL